MQQLILDVIQQILSATLGTATATDGCGTPTVNAGVDGADQSNGCLRTRTRTFTATDACGNTATISRTVTWTADVTPPVFTGYLCNSRSWM